MIGVEEGRLLDEGELGCGGTFVIVGGVGASGSRSSLLKKVVIGGEHVLCLCLVFLVGYLADCAGQDRL